MNKCILIMNINSCKFPVKKITWAVDTSTGTYCLLLRKQLTLFYLTTNHYVKIPCIFTFSLCRGQCSSSHPQAWRFRSTTSPFAWSLHIHVFKFPKGYDYPTVPCAAFNRFHAPLQSKNIEIDGLVFLNYPQCLLVYVLCVPLLCALCFLAHSSPALDKSLENGLVDIFIGKGALACFLWKN